MDTTTHDTIEQASFSNEELNAVDWFDYDEVDRLLGLAETSHEDARAQAAEMFSQIMAWIWGAKQGGIKTAMVRFTAFSSGLRPDLLNDKTYLELAKELGCSKQILSHYSLEISEKFGIKFARSRQDEARANMAAKALGHPNHNFGKNSVRLDTLGKELC